MTLLKPSHEWNLENYGKLLVNIHNIILKHVIITFDCEKSDGLLHVADTGICGLRANVLFHANANHKPTTPYAFCHFRTAEVRLQPTCTCNCLTIIIV